MWGADWPEKTDSTGEFKFMVNRNIVNDLGLSQENLDEQPAPRFDDDWGNRTLCSDESCIGVIGPDGRCKECGQPYEG